MRNSSIPVLHLAHPRPVLASTIFSVFSEKLSLPLISFSEWVGKLEQSSADFKQGQEADVAAQNPALRMLDFFKSGVSAPNCEAFGAPRMDLSHAAKTAASLHGDRLPQLGLEDALAWMSSW